MSAKKTICIFTILVLITSCQKKKVEVAKPKTNETTIMDSTNVDSLGERKSIHQQEWEEHQKELTDTVKTKLSF